MQHKERVPAQEAGGVETESQILAHAFTGVPGDGLFGIVVAPCGLHRVHSWADFTSHTPRRTSFGAPEHHSARSG